MATEVELLTRANHLVPAGDVFIDGDVDHHAAHIDALGLAQGLVLAHAQGLHGTGVARGLAVSMSTDAAGKSSVQVAPGVAVDSSGRHVLLAAGGAAETSPNAVEPDGPSAAVAVTDAGVSLPIPVVTAAQTLILTIEHFERSTTDGSDQLPTLRHTPWLRWLMPAELASNRDSIPLAVASLSPTTTPTLQPGTRVKTALEAAGISVFTSALTAGVVQEERVARLAPLAQAPTQGVELTVSAPAVVLRLGAESGPASTIQLDASMVSATGRLGVWGTCSVSGELGVSGACTLASTLRVGTAPNAVAIARFAAEPLDSMATTDLAVTAPTSQTVLNLVNRAVPSGTVMAYASPLIPAGWLECNGTSLDGANLAYAGLFHVIGKAFGGGNGSATGFNLPDLRGRFVRGWNRGSGRDPDAGGRAASASGGNAGDSIGSLQNDTYAAHGHNVSAFGTSGIESMYHSHPVEGTSWTGWSNANLSFGGPYPLISTITFPASNTGAQSVFHTHNVSVSGSALGTGGNETRPRNIYLIYIIKL